MRRHVDLVRGGAGNRIPAQHRHLGLVAGRARIGVGARIGQVVAHAQVLDARARCRRHLVEGLREGRAGVPDARVPARVERANAPVVGVVLEARRSARSELPITGLVQQTFEPGAKSTDGLISSSYLAAPAIGSQEKSGSKTSGAANMSSTRVERARRPRPHERLHRRGRAAMPLGVDRRDVPVVGAGRQQRRARRVDRAGGLVLRVARSCRATDRSPIETMYFDARGTDDQRSTSGCVGCTMIAPCVGDCSAGADVHDFTSARGAVQDDGVPFFCERAHAPPVGAVRDRLLQRRARVARRELILAAPEHRRVHPAVGGELELVPVGLRDGGPRERGQRVDARGRSPARRASASRARQRRASPAARRRPPQRRSARQPVPHPSVILRNLRATDPSSARRAPRPLPQRSGPTHPIDPAPDHVDAKKLSASISTGPSVTMNIAGRISAIRGKRIFVGVF